MRKRIRSSKHLNDYHYQNAARSSSPTQMNSKIKAHLLSALSFPCEVLMVQQVTLEKPTDNYSFAAYIGIAYVDSIAVT